MSKERIKELLLGKQHTHEQIADIVGVSTKTVQRQARSMEAELAEYKNLNIEDKSLEQMTREERYKYLQSIFEHTPRCKFIYEGLRTDEQAFFLDEYMKIIKSTESITEAEEQQLFSACLEYVMAFRNLKLNNQEEEMYNETVKGTWKAGDVRFRLQVDDRFQKAYDQHLKTYQKFMDQLKMSRAQRLDKIRSDKRTLTDLASELTQKSAQSNAVERIVELSKLGDEELKRLIDNNCIMGYFA